MAKNEKKTETTVGDIKRIDRVTEFNKKFVHNISITYPTANVEKMLQSWKDTVETAQNWLDTFDNTLKTTVEQGETQLEAGLLKAKKEHEIFLTLDDKEKFRRLMDVFNKERARNQAMIDNMAQEKEKLRIQLTTQLEGYKKKIQEDKKTKEDAIKLWNNPTRR